MESNCTVVKKVTSGSLTPSLFILLPLETPLLVFISWGAPPHLDICAALWRAVGCHTHVGVRVVDGPVLRELKDQIYN